CRPSNPSVISRWIRPTKMAVMGRLAGRARRVHAVADVVELRAGALTDRCYGLDDDDGDQRHHERVLDRGRAALFLGPSLEPVPPRCDAGVHTKEHVTPLPSGDPFRARARAASTPPLATVGAPSPPGNSVFP